MPLDEDGGGARLDQLPAARRADPVHAMLMTGSQIAYVTTNTSAALDAMSDRLSICRFTSRDVTLDVIDSTMQASDRISVRASFATEGLREIEIVEPLDESTPVFMDRGAGQDATLRLHHIGCYVDDLEAIVSRARQMNWSFLRARNPRVDVVFVDTRLLVGHWLEAIHVHSQ